MTPREALTILEEVFRREADRAFWASDEAELLEALAVLRAGVKELERWRLGHKAATFVSKEPK